MGQGYLERPSERLWADVVSRSERHIPHEQAGEPRSGEHGRHRREERRVDLGIAVVQARVAPALRIEGVGLRIADQADHARGPALPECVGRCATDGSERDGDAALDVDGVQGGTQDRLPAADENGTPREVTQRAAVPDVWREVVGEAELGNALPAGDEELCALQDTGLFEWDGLAVAAADGHETRRAALVLDVPGREARPVRTGGASAQRVVRQVARVLLHGERVEGRLLRPSRDHDGAEREQCEPGYALPHGAPMTVRRLSVETCGATLDMI
jgi:hypothetical protein